MRYLIIIGCIAWQAVTGQVSDTKPIGRGVILGVVTDTGLRPIGGVEVSVVLSSVRVATDVRGRFQISGIPTGDYLLMARRLGFQPIAVALSVSAPDTARPAIMLAPAAADLPTVTIVAPTGSARLHEFNERRARGEGEFFTQAEIDARSAVATVDILRQARGVRVSPEGGHLFPMSARQYTRCPMQVYVDGLPLAGAKPNEPLDLNLLPSPKDLLGIEIYSGPATVPQWLFNGAVSTGHSCGVILLWTKDGSSD